MILAQKIHLWIFNEMACDTISMIIQKLTLDSKIYLNFNLLSNFNQKLF